MPLMEGLVQHRSLLQADGEAKVLGCIREAVDDVLQGFLHVGEKDTVISKQQLSDEFLDGFHVFREMPKIKETAVCSEADVDAVWQVLFFASWSMMLKKMENIVEARMQPCLTPLEMGKLPDRDPLCFT